MISRNKIGSGRRGFSRAVSAVLLSCAFLLTGLPGGVLSPSHMVAEAASRAPAPKPAPRASSKGRKVVPVPKPSSNKKRLAPSAKPRTAGKSGSSKVSYAPTPKSRPKSFQAKPGVKSFEAYDPGIRAVAAPKRPKPTGRGVDGAATLKDAMPLNDLALIGVFGGDKGRRALVRHPNGDVQRVKKGGNVDGWTVVSIDSASLRLKRGSKARVLDVVQ